VVHSQARPGSSAVALQSPDSTISAFTRAHWIRALAVRELSGKEGLLRPAFEVLWARIAAEASSGRSIPRRQAFQKRTVVRLRVPGGSDPSLLIRPLTPVDQAVAMKQVDPTPAPSLTRGRS
jgi:hypothetical protein